MGTGGREGPRDTEYSWFQILAQDSSGRGWGDFE